jgi:hypothetical protein
MGAEIFLNICVHPCPICGFIFFFSIFESLNGFDYNTIRKRDTAMANLINFFDYEQAGRARMPEAFFGYYAGGAGDEITLHENRAVFDRIKLRPAGRRAWPRF